MFSHFCIALQQVRNVTAPVEGVIDWSGRWLVWMIGRGRSRVCPIPTAQTEPSLDSLCYIIYFMTANKRPAPLTLTDKRNSRARIGSQISAARSDSQSHALSPLSPSPFQVPTISNINAMRSASMVHVRRVDYVASIFSFLPCSKKTDSRRRRRFWSRPVWLHLSSIVFFFFFAYRHLRRWSRVGGWKTFASRPAPSSCLHNSDHGGGPNRDMPVPEIPTWLGDEREQRERESRFMELRVICAYVGSCMGRRARCRHRNVVVAVHAGVEQPVPRIRTPRNLQS